MVGSQLFHKLTILVLMLVTLTFTGTGIGIIVGCIFNEVEVALNIVPLIFFPLMLFSGFYVNSGSIQWYVRWIEIINPLRYTLEAGIYNEFEDTTWSPNPISSFGFENGYWNSLLIVAFIGLIIRILGYIALFINARTT